MVNIKKLSEKNNITKLLVKGTNSAFMNGIRRTVMKDVPTLAVEDVSIYENTSVMFDEFLVQRLGLLPIKTDLKTYKKGDKVKLVLEKEGPGVVYSKDIKCTDPKIEVINKKVPLVKLKKDQKIKIEMSAMMGTGEEHSKWQPAVISYHNLPIIENEKGCDLCEECVKACPKNVLEIKARKVVLKDPLNCILCGECRDKCKKDVLTLDYDEASFVLTIEPTGALSVQEILSHAADVLMERTKELKKSLKEP